PIGYGMPKNAAALFMNGPAWRVNKGRSVAEFSRENPLLSGLMIGSERITGATALASIPMGRGEVIMFGFRPHFRAQARGTYKLFFNAIYSSVLS
ncbi:MAG: peptidase M14, partial [SAR202 cluster bacterium]|nr:peptidase M14 [SAR202 cluster bacterium]